VRFDSRLLVLAGIIFTASAMSLCAPGCAGSEVDPDFVGFYGENVWVGGFQADEDMHNGSVALNLEKWLSAFQEEGLDCDIMGAFEDMSVMYRPGPFKGVDGTWYSGMYHPSSNEIEVGFYYPDGPLAMGHELGHAFMGHCGIDSSHPTDCKALQTPECCQRDVLCDWATRYGTPY
jgi:hypothetical protein